MNKIAATIEKLERETGAIDILNVSKKMLDRLRSFDLNKAQELSDLFDAFLKDNRFSLFHCLLLFQAGITRLFMPAYADYSCMVRATTPNGYLMKFLNLYIPHYT
ncbi:MAG: hypothetical protein LBN98_01775 [Prevotellaceae bacterium]|jgi:hypothetical protein|nr:hypothetical protein [Prevotellaceae bacterium]